MEITTTLSSDQTPGMLGNALMIASMDIPVGDAAPEGFERDFNAWYTHEHLPERLSVPGIFRTTRYERSERSAGDATRYLTVYEAESTSVFSSPEYLYQADHPTELSRYVIAARRAAGTRTGRTVLSIKASIGRGIGREMAIVEFAPVDEDECERWIVDELAPAVLANPELCGFHLVAADRESTDAKQATTDGKAFGKTESITDWALIIEGTHGVAVLAERLLLGDDALGGSRVAAVGQPKHYELVVTMLARD